MLGDLVDLYQVAGHSSTAEQQELLVRDPGRVKVLSCCVESFLTDITYLV